MKFYLEAADNTKAFGYIDFGTPEYHHYVEINTLEELIDLMKKYNNDIIISGVIKHSADDEPTIKIYNDYIE